MRFPHAYPASHSPHSTSTSDGPTSQHTPIRNLLSAILGNSLNLPLSHFFIHKVEILFTSPNELSQGLIS